MKRIVNKAYFLAIMMATTSFAGWGQMAMLDRMGGSANQQSNRNKMDGQDGKTEKDDEEDPCLPLLDKRYCFTLDPLTGQVHPSVPDTTFIGLGNRQSMESKALVVNYTGNLYSPHLVEAYFDRKKAHDFIFANAYNLFRDDPADMLYYNTRMPITTASYSKSGSSLQENDHLKINFFGNFKKEFGIGSMIDYVYARGIYPYTASKPLKWKSYGYYEGEQYKLYATYTQQKLANQENGGILERGYILNPDGYISNLTEPRNMPTHLVNSWSDNRSHNIHLQHSYDLGKWVERWETPDDSTSIYDEFVPMASVFQNFDFESWKHVFRLQDGYDATARAFFPNHYIDTLQTADSTRYRDFSTYAGIRLNEGFSKFSQFNISAFVGYERQHYVMLTDTLNPSYIGRHHISNSFWVGGQLSRTLSSILTFDVTARVALSGDKSGDFEVKGVAQSVIPFGKADTLGHKSDSIIVRANAFIDNGHTPYLMQRYFSNHFRWNNRKFDQEQHVRIEGTASYPRTGTSLRFGVEHINNYHYYDNEGLPQQTEKQIDITALEVRQNLHAGQWLNWDNALLLQYCSEQSKLPLPTVSVESDFSLQFTIAKTLKIQAGVAAYWHTKYYAPTYQPATQQFVMQHDYKCGNFPVLNGYVNCNLKRIKFFMTMHNMINGAVTNNTFLMPYYPMMPRRFEYGIILDLQN